MFNPAWEMELHFDRDAPGEQVTLTETRFILPKRTKRTAVNGPLGPL
jgi:hypothetical protein